jgi:hypothetical protein
VLQQNTMQKFAIVVLEYSSPPIYFTRKKVKTGDTSGDKANNYKTVDPGRRHRHDVNVYVTSIVTNEQLVRRILVCAPKFRKPNFCATGYNLGFMMSAPFQILTFDPPNCIVGNQCNIEPVRNNQAW